MSKERRSVPRIRMTVPVELYDVNGVDLLAIGQMYDLGINCAGLDTVLALEKDQTFFMRFSLEKRFLVNVWARVARVEKRGRKTFYGVRFEKIDFLQKEDLLKFINTRLKEEEQ